MSSELSHLRSRVLMAIGSAAAAAVVLGGPCTSALADANTGLTAGVVTPAWAAKARVHFFPSADLGFAVPASGDLGRRCESTYCPSVPLEYKGGSGVQHDPIVYMIFDGSNWNGAGATLKTNLEALYGGFSGSSSAYQGILGQYYDATGYVTGNVAGTSFTDTRVGAPAGVNDSAIRAEVAYAVAQKNWTRTFDAQFVVFTAPGSTFESGWASNFCAYHGVDSSGSSYTFVPDVSDEPFHGLCSSYDASNNVEHVTSMLASHEYAESATDPQLNTWRDSNGYEIADICASADDSLPDGAWVQGLWDNAQGACSLSDTSQYFPTRHDAPAETFGSEGGLYVTTEGLTGSLFATTRNPSGEWLPANLTAAPLTTYSGSADAFGPEGTLYVATEGPDHSLYVTARYGAAWHGPYQVDGSGTTYSTPSVVVGAEGNLYVATQGPSETLYVTVHNTLENKWYGPYQIDGPGTTYSAPSETVGPESNLYVAAEGPNNTLYVTDRESSTTKWAGPYEVARASTTYSAPSVVLGPGKALFVAAQGPNNTLYVTAREYPSGKWVGPYQIDGSGTTYSTPTEVLGSESNVFVAAQGPNNTLYVTAREYSSGSWAGPYQIDGANTTYSTPAAVLGADKNVYVAAEGPNNTLYVTAREYLTTKWIGPFQIAEPGTTN